MEGSFSEQNLVGPTVTRPVQDPLAVNSWRTDYRWQYEVSTTKHVLFDRLQVSICLLQIVTSSNLLKW